MGEDRVREKREDSGSYPEEENIKVSDLNE
jgi:hypothetical protein